MLIVSPRFSCAVSMGSRNQPSNHGRSSWVWWWGWAAALWKKGSEVYSDRLRGSLRVSSCSKPVFFFFFPKVISPTNYNGAVVTMVVVQDRSRRYNPPSSPPPQIVFNFLFFMVVRNVNQSCEYPQALSFNRLPEFTCSRWYSCCGVWAVKALQETLPEHITLISSTHSSFITSMLSLSEATTPTLCRSQPKTPPVPIPTIVPPGQQVPFSAFLSASFFLLLSVTPSFTATVVSSTNKSPLCHLCPSRCWRTITLVFFKTTTMKSEDQV